MGGQQVGMVCASIGKFPDLLRLILVQSGPIIQKCSACLPLAFLFDTVREYSNYSEKMIIPKVV